MHAHTADMHQASTPTAIVVLGATGDLSRKKILPALFDLYVQSRLPDTFRIVGLSREEQTDEAFRAFVREVIGQKGHEHGEKEISAFLERVFYTQGMLQEANAYRRLGERLDEWDAAHGVCKNKLFYLAVPPALYEAIFEQLAKSGLTKPCSEEAGWTRVLVEKPFGENLETARTLDQKLGELFREEQIFRIDHYLAKDTIQNIIAFRFANTVFEQIWSAACIDHISIVMKEEFGVENRGAFYDGVGALRDVGENHLLQMLALVAMEHPGSLETDAMRTARANALSALKVCTAEDVHEHTVRAQYAGYRAIDGVAEGSETETYFQIRAFLESDRWRDVPFYLESGKSLNETRTEIRIVFRSPERCLCGKRHADDLYNVLRIASKPEREITIRFYTKVPGLSYDIEPRDFSFRYDDAREFPDAYEKVLFDAIVGDQTLFTSSEEVEAAWRFITPILENWQAVPLREYEKGSTGPGKALDMPRIE